MNAIFPQFLKSAYRKEPISSFLVIVGVVDAVMGGVGGRGSLLTFGLLLALSGALVRWRRIGKMQTVIADTSPKRALPPSSSRPPVPMLISKNNRQPKI